MKIAWLNPTYGCPRLTQNLLAQFEAQTYPADKRRLFILDDASQFGPPIVKPAMDMWLEDSWGPGNFQKGENWSLFSTPHKFSTLIAKYHWLVNRACEWGAEAFVVADTDDIYLPDHTENHALVLCHHHAWSHPATVWSLYTGQLVEEDARGRFHAALAFHRIAGNAVGYWGPVNNGRCDYDQRILRELEKKFIVGRSTEPPTFVMRWGSSGFDHCSGRATRDPESTDWYTQTPTDGTRLDVLAPKMDDETIRVYEHFGWSPDGTPAIVQGHL